LSKYYCSNRTINEMSKVLKFGGSSLSEKEKILKAAHLIKEHYKEDKKIIVVVSAMGTDTDELMRRAKFMLQEKTVTESKEREIDMLLSTGERVSASLLALALQNIAVDSVSLTGSQMGIEVYGPHTAARISNIKATRLDAYWKQGKVVVVAGFQGVNANKDICTIGRGGSDTTALAISCFLKDSQVYIYSDVSHVYSADPNLLAGTKKYSKLDYLTCYLLSVWGAKVLQKRSIALAARYKKKINLRSSLKENKEGTSIMSQSEIKMEKACVRSIALKKKVHSIVLDKDDKNKSILLASCLRVKRRKSSLKLLVAEEDLALSLKHYIEETKSYDILTVVGFELNLIYEKIEKVLVDFIGLEKLSECKLSIDNNIAQLRIPSKLELDRTKLVDFVHSGLKENFHS